MFHGAQHVGGEARGDRQLRAVLPEVEETVGHDVLGDHAVADVRLCDPDETRFVIGVQGVERFAGDMSVRAVHGEV